MVQVSPASFFSTSPFDTVLSNQFLVFVVNFSFSNSLADISANLKSKVSKVQAQKTLATLHEKGEILGKVYGKTTVYCALQVIYFP